MGTFSPPKRGHIFFRGEIGVSFADASAGEAEVADGTLTGPSVASTAFVSTNMMIKNSVHLRQQHSRCVSQCDG